MPPDTDLDVNDTDADSSTATDATVADSSTAQDDKPLSEIVREAAEKSGSTEVTHEEQPDTSSEEEPVKKDKADQEEPAKPDETEEEEEQTDEEEAEPADKDKVLPFHNHPRWKEVLAERDTQRAEVEKLRPQAETAQALQQYCETNGISQQDLEQALELTALSRKNIPEFRKRMGEFLENIDIVQGTKLPADLQKKVDDGLIDADSAKELAQHRIKVRQSEGQTMSAEQRALEARTQSIASVLNSWEASQKKSDLGFDKRYTFLKARVSELWTANPPTTPQAAIRMVEQANKEVKEAVGKFLPKPPKRKALRNTSSSINNGETMKLDNLETDLGPLVRAVAAKHR